MTNFAAIDVGQKLVEKEMIDILKQNLIFYKTAKISKLNKGANTKTVVFRMWNRQTLVSTPLGEGTPPAGQDMSMANVTAVVAQYGDFTKITDLAEFLFDRSLIKDASEVLGIQATESIDTLIVNVLAAGTNVLYGDGSVLTRVTVAQTMKLTTLLLTRAIRFLERNNVKKFSNVPVIGGGYAIVAHPDVFADIRLDTNFVAAVNYSSPTPNNPNRGDLFTGEMGFWLGGRLIATTIAPLFGGAGAAGKDVYGILCYGVGAFGVSELAPGLETYIHTGGVQDTGNPLEQFSTVGWKWAGATAILDNKRLIRLEVGATYQGAAA